MKLIYFLFILAAVLFSACDKGLEVKPTDAIPAPDVFKSKKGLLGALAGSYNTLQSASIYQDVTLFGDLAADNLIHVGTKKEYRQISDNRIVAENAYIVGLWNNAYDGINRVNNILAYIDNVPDITDDEKEVILGQAYFLRAYYHFVLAKYFGGVVLRTKPTIAATPEFLDAPRASEAETYRFIINDLLTAETLFNDKSFEGSIYASSGTTKALLARLYLYQHVYDSAAIKANEVLNMNYNLESNSYDNLFIRQAENSEFIFRIQFTADEAINSIPDWTLPTGRFEVAAWDTYDKTSSIADVFDPSDSRKDITVQVSDDANYCNKYQDLLTDNDNVIIIRLAEMYLIRAEALNEIAYVADGEAFELLNTIRTRANLPTYSSVNLSTQAAFSLAIEKERRLEFAFEGHRYFDLKRTGRINEVLPDIGTLKGANWLFPIPQSELDTNNDANMKQNSGY